MRFMNTRSNESLAFVGQLLVKVEKGETLPSLMELKRARKFLLGAFELYEKYGESFIGNLIDTFKVTDEIIGTENRQIVQRFREVV